MNDSVIEVAVFSTTTTPDQRQTHNILASYTGFVESLALVGQKDPLRRADLIVWDSHQNAMHAAARIREDERIAPFLSMIHEILHFQHYAWAEGARLVNLARAPIVEIAAYRVAQDKQLASLQGQVHAALNGVDGYMESAPLLSSNDEVSEDIMLDLIGWQDVQSHVDAPPALMANHPELASFFQGIEQMDVFDLFTVLP